jgi:hypothetical protein
MTENITAVLMLEILGKPAEYIGKTLSEIVDKLGKEKNVRVVNKKIAEPKLVEGQENLFTSFAEVEIETSLDRLMLLIFGYMPSHIDIITPEELKVKNSDLNLFFNELTRKLHQYDELAKSLMIERQIIAKQIQDGKIKIVKEGKKEKQIKEKKTTKKAGKRKKSN